VPAKPQSRLHDAAEGRDTLLNTDLFTQYVESVAGRFLCSVTARIRSASRMQTKACPISYGLAPFPTSINTPLHLCIKISAFTLEIRFREEGMATGRLLPCSWDGHALGFSLSISELRKNAFVKTAPGVTIFYPSQRRDLKPLRVSIGIPSNARHYSHNETMQRCVPPLCSWKMNAMSLIDLYCRTLSADETRKERGNAHRRG